MGARVAGASWGFWLSRWGSRRRVSRTAGPASALTPRPSIISRSSWILRSWRRGSSRACGSCTRSRRFLIFSPESRCKISPGNPGAPLAAIYAIAGFATAAILASLLHALGLGRALAIVLALAFASTPAFLLYENWYFYPHLEQLAIVSAAAAFQRSRGRAGGWLAVAFAGLAALAMLRSLFHPAFLVIAVGAAVGCVPRTDRKRALALASVPLAVVLAWSLKNAILFGFFGTSSWGGNSLHRMFTESVPRDRLEAWVTDGVLGPLSLEWEFSPPAVYREILGPTAGQDRGVPALDEMGKTRTRENPVNYNHWIYPPVSRVYAKSAMVMMRKDPHAYLESVRWTSRRFLDPVTDDAFLRPNRHPIRRWARLEESIESSVLVRVAAAVVFLGAILALVRGRVRFEERLVVFFLAGVVAWIAIAGIAFEYGENNRFRYSTLAPLFVLSVVAARDVWRRLSRDWVRAPILGE